MSSEFLIDNDVVKKLAIYGLFSELVAITKSAQRSLGVLGAAPFVLTKAIERSKSIRTKEAALARLHEALAECDTVEPDEAEIQLAARIEDRAQLMGLPFDLGESLLIAVLAFRASAVLATGDKRALGCAVAAVGDSATIDGISGRVGCLEQVLFHLVQYGEGVEYARSVCNEPDTDKAISICFGCASSFNLEAALTGLESYIEDVRKSATPLLSAGLTIEDLLEKNSVGLS